MTEIRSTRRQFLQTACAAVGMTALGNTIFDLQRIAAAAPLVDYKSLVCIFLYGGNDGNNVIVPAGGTDYAQYAAARASLALPQSSLLPLNPLVHRLGIRGRGASIRASPRCRACSMEAGPPWWPTWGRWWRRSLARSS